MLPSHIFLLAQTVDQFFALKVPMRPSELNGLFRGIDNAFQVFSNHVVEKLGEYVLHVNILFIIFFAATYFDPIRSTSLLLILIKS